MTTDRDKRSREDFDFMVLCASKGNMSMYSLLRDRSLDKPEPEPLKASDVVTFEHYGEPKAGVIEGIGDGGKIVFLQGGRWLHLESATRIYTLTVGGRYNWKNQSERLIYMGLCEPRNGHWHQFALVEAPDVCWCEVTPDDLAKLEPTKEGS